jgi:hypothetical protein
MVAPSRPVRWVWQAGCRCRCAARAAAHASRQPRCRIGAGAICGDRKRMGPELPGRALIGFVEATDAPLRRRTTCRRIAWLPISSASLAARGISARGFADAAIGQIEAVNPCINAVVVKTTSAWAAANAAPAGHRPVGTPRSPPEAARLKVGGRSTSAPCSRRLRSSGRYWPQRTGRAKRRAGGQPNRPGCEWRVGAGSRASDGGRVRRSARHGTDAGRRSVQRCGVLVMPDGEFAHLPHDVRSLALLDAEARIAHIRAERWIQHPAAAGCSVICKRPSISRSASGWRTYCSWARAAWEKPC